VPGRLGGDLRIPRVIVIVDGGPLE
jgi:hypothetical protein